MKNTEYIKWLKKEIATQEAKRQKAEDDYQETGTPRYYKAMVDKEYTVRALTDSLKLETDQNDRHNEVYRNAVGVVIDLAENAKELLPPEEALKGILEELYKLKRIY